MKIKDHTLCHLENPIEEEVIGMLLDCIIIYECLIVII